MGNQSIIPTKWSPCKNPEQQVSGEPLSEQHSMCCSPQRPGMQCILTPQGHIQCFLPDWFNPHLFPIINYNHEYHHSVNSVSLSSEWSKLRRVLETPCDGLFLIACVILSRLSIQLFKQTLMQVLLWRYQYFVRVVSTHDRLILSKAVTSDNVGGFPKQVESLKKFPGEEEILSQMQIKVCLSFHPN